MLSLFDHTKPVPEKASNMTLYRGSVSDLVNFIHSNPTYRGKFLSETTETAELANQAMATCSVLKMDPKDYYIGLTHFIGDLALAQVAHMLNCDAERHAPHQYVVVTDSERWATELWGVLEAVPKEVV